MMNQETYDCDEVWTATVEHSVYAATVRVRLKLTTAAVDGAMVTGDRSADTR